MTASALAVTLAARHGAALRAAARRHSLDPDDAHDACQRALEILLRKAPSLRDGDAVAWLTAVVRNEARAIRRQRLRAVPVGPGEALADLRPPAPGADERAAARERLRLVAAALGDLKPHERRALALRVEGYSYREIQAATGWTYTKVDRCLKEGRARLRARLGAVAPQAAGARSNETHGEDTLPIQAGRGSPGGSTALAYVARRR